MYSSVGQNHYAGIAHVSSTEREDMLRKQKDAMLRKRKQQLQSGFVRSMNPANSRTNLQSNQSIVPTVKTFKITSKRVPFDARRSDEMTYAAPIISEHKNDFHSTNNGSHKIDESIKREQIIRDVTIPCIDKNELLYEDDEGEQKPGNVPCIDKSPILNEKVEDNLCMMEKKISLEETDDVSSATESSEVIRVSINDETDTKEDRPEKMLSSDPLWTNINWNDKEEVKKLLMSPCPKGKGLIKCYIRRNKGKAKMFPEYRVYLQDEDIFLMTSKKRAKKQSSNYLISMGRNDFGKHSDNIIGKLRANFLGTEFQIFDNGTNPKHVDPFYDEKNDDEPRSELGAILYSSNIIGNRGPRKMKVCINKIGNDGMMSRKWQPVHKDEEMIQCFKHKTEKALLHLKMYENRQPRWNEDMGSYVLNFNNRVNLASVKNFQLIEPDTENENVVLQFGKVSNDEFIMDVQWPMSLFQAFAIALSSFDSKLACD